MNRLAIIALAVVVALATYAGLARGEQTPRADHAPRVAVVIGGAAADDAALVARVAGLTRARHEPLRVAVSPTQQLAATHLLAAEGYDTIVAVGLDRAVAVEPVAARYPRTRFELR